MYYNDKLCYMMRTFFAQNTRTISSSVKPYIHEDQFDIQTILNIHTNFFY